MCLFFLDDAAQSKLGASVIFFSELKESSGSKTRQPAGYLVLSK